MTTVREPMASVAREMQGQAPLRAVRLGTFDPVVEHGAGGVIHIRAARALGRYHDNLSQPL